MPDTTKRTTQRAPRAPRAPQPYTQRGEFLRTPNINDPHGHVLSLLGEEWRVIHAIPSERHSGVPGNVAATYNHRLREITIDPDEDFYTYMLHEVIEFLLGEFGCRYENFDDDAKFILTHTQLDVFAKQLAGALTSLRSARKKEAHDGNGY